MVRENQTICRVGDGDRTNHCGMGSDSAENGRKGHVGGIAPGTKVDIAHRDAGIGRVEDVPAIAEINLDVSMKVRRAERWVGAVVGAGGKARWNIEGAAEGNHQVREVATNTDLLDQRVDRRGL